MTTLGTATMMATIKGFFIWLGWPIYAYLNDPLTLSTKSLPAPWVAKRGKVDLEWRNFFIIEPIWLI